MRFAGQHVTWSVTAAWGDPQGCGVETGMAPGGRDALKLAVDARGPLDVHEEDTWPVEPGRAYLLVASAKTDLRQAYGQLRLVWLDAGGQELGWLGSAFTFLEHEFAPLEIWGLAPAGAVAARAAFQLIPVRSDMPVARGGLLLAPASFESSLYMEVEPRATAALFDADAPADYYIALRGAPSDLKQAQVHYVLTDYNLEQVVAGDLAVALLRGEGRQTLALPALEPGYYELALETDSPGLAAMRGRYSLAALTALDFVPPRDYPISLDAGLSWPCDGGLSGAGDRGNYTRLETSCAACVRLGLRALRDRLSWAQVNMVPGQFDWGVYRRTAEAQRAAGLDVYQLFHDTPEWASVVFEDATHRQGNRPPKDPRSVYEFTRRLALDLGADVRYFELWNEPDVHFWGGHPWDLAALIKAGYLGLKDADPTLGVLGASRCTKADFWRELLANGTGPYMDIWNQHSYSAPEGQFELLQEDRDLMAAVGVQYPMWMTEMGQRSTPARDGSYTIAERVQVSYLLRAYACGLAAGLDRFHYFYLQEFLEYGVHLWGLQRADLSPKPAMVALGALIRQVRDAAVVGYLQEGGRYCVVFQRQPGDYVGLAWSIEGSPIRPGWGADLPELEGKSWSYAEGSWDLPVVPGACLVNAVGTVLRNLPGDARHCHLDLSLEPVFVRGLDVSRLALEPVPNALHYTPCGDPIPAERYVWLQAVARPDQPRLAQEDVQTQKLALYTAAGKVEEVALCVHNYSDAPASVQVELELPEGWSAQSSGSVASVAAHASAELRVRCVVGALEAGQVYALGASLSLDGRPRDHVAVYYTAEPQAEA